MNCSRIGCTNAATKYPVLSFAAKSMPTGPRAEFKFPLWPTRASEIEEAYAVACDASEPGGPGGCGSMSGFAPTEAEAVERWNRRAA